MLSKKAVTNVSKHLWSVCRFSSSSKSAFKHTDPFNLEGLLTDEEKELRDKARKYCDDKLMPRVKDSFNEESFDDNYIRELGQQKLIGVIHSEYGLPGASSVASGLINREIERVDSGFRSVSSVQSSLVVFPIMSYANKSVKDKVIPKLTSGEYIGCFGLTEPNHGSDPGSMESRAVDKGDHFLLTGSKTWITNSPYADVFVVWAKNEEGKVKGFVLTKDMEGLTAPKISGKFSLRASCTGMIMMEEVKVPKDHLLNITGLAGPFSCLNQARLGISWGSMGAAEYCYEQALRFAKTNIRDGKPLAANPSIQKKLTEMCTEIYSGLHASLRVSRLKDEDNLAPEMISMVKRNNCGKALQIARDAREIMGLQGLEDNQHVMRHLTNLETVNTYEGTHDVHGLILGRAITGLHTFF